MIFLLATSAGSLGALSRYFLSGFVQRRIETDFPVGTLTVNLIGAFLIGLVVGFDNLQSPATLAAAGFLGGFTTFSTWMIETIRLGFPPWRNRALINLVVQLVAGGILAAAGYSLTD